MNLLNGLDQRRHWWKIFVLVFAVSISVVGYLGYQTYEYAPPIRPFVDPEGRIRIDSADIIAGQKLFFRYGLMEYGSFLGDGSLRGPDFTAEALNQMALAMTDFYHAKWRDRIPDTKTRQALVQSLVQEELKTNQDDGQKIVLLPAQVSALGKLEEFYKQKFGAGGNLVGIERFHPDHYIVDPTHIRQLTAFFFWGGWLCAARRPGYAYSYTHNWPYAPLAGNTPHGAILLWSLIGLLAVILTVGILFYYYGRINSRAVWDATNGLLPLATVEVVRADQPTPTQRATYKYFAVAALLFLVQVIAGLWVIVDFLGWNTFLPMTIPRAWHTQISILWIAVCWFGTTLWILPRITGQESAGQLRLVNLLFWMLVVVAVGGTMGIFLGLSGQLGNGALVRWFGLQGWEFMEIGRAYHVLLFMSFLLWLVIVLRGTWPVLKKRQTWSLPNWMVYTISGILFMFSASFVAGPDTNFVIADFWRWCLVHMWVEAFFELFTTILVAYFLYFMGLVNHAVAARVVYLSALLFLGSGLIGISHNFYWNAKSMESIALGGVLSSLQVVPLVLLTVEAWKFQGMPRRILARSPATHTCTFGLSEAFLFLVGVNFWNFFGAGVLGFIINLPIVNYYQHGTYLTVNHGHAALMGVYGNLAIAAMLFCARWLVSPNAWNERLLRVVFWSLNLGLALMVAMDLFPAGIHQLMAVLSEGYAFARSNAYVQGAVFQWFTLLRGAGITVFVVGGVAPLVYFILSRWRKLKAARSYPQHFFGDIADTKSHPLGTRVFCDGHPPTPVAMQ